MPQFDTHNHGQAPRAMPVGTRENPIRLADDKPSNGNGCVIAIGVVLILLVVIAIGMFAPSPNRANNNVIVTPAAPIIINNVIPTAAPTVIEKRVEVPVIREVEVIRRERVLVERPVYVDRPVIIERVHVVPRPVLIVRPSSPDCDDAEIAHAIRERRYRETAMPKTK